MAARAGALEPVSSLQIVSDSLPRPPVIDSSVRIPALDGLRGVAILLVLVWHSVFELQPQSPFLSRLLIPGRLTWSGVDLFFVLSGFLIGGILLDVSGSRNYFKTFYLRRAYRILPLYFLVLLGFSLRFLTPRSSAGPLGSFSPSVIPWFSYLIFTQNFWMAALGSFGVGVMAATWSLAVEEQFYLTIPLVIRKLTRSRLAILLIAVVLAAPILRTSLHLFFAHGNFADYVLLPCRADALCLGVLAALIVRTPESWQFLLSHAGVLRRTGGLLLAGVILLDFRGDQLGTPMVTVGYTWLAMFYATGLLMAATGASPILNRFLTNSLLRRLGVLAYSTYLLNLPLMEAMRRVLGLHFEYGSSKVQFAGGILGVLLTLLVAEVSWRFLEKPLLRRGHRHQY